MKILMHVSFLGTKYCGYQIQPNGVTVQQKLNEATKGLFGFDCDIVGCSRTDSGVHANEFCVAVSRKGSPSLETTIPPERIPLAIAPYLPEDISVFRAETVEDSFHPRYDVKYKEYVYHIWDQPHRNPFFADRSWHYPKHLSDEAVEKMDRAAKLFCGTWDFASYMAADSKITDSVRTVFEAEVTRRGELVEFRICANGFLYHMVRILMGTLIAVAEGRLEPEEIPSVTQACDRRRAGITAPAEGLFLNRVVY